MSKECAGGGSARYARKAERVLAAASEILNRKGVKGMTLADVAEAVGINPSGITYYFRRKEDLAAACMLDATQRFRDMIADAAGAADPPARISRFLRLFLELQFRIRAGETPALAGFRDVHAFGPPHDEAVNAGFVAMFRELRGLLLGPGPAPERRTLNARANLLLEQVLWSVAWLPLYDAEDLPRLHDRMFDLAAHGLARPGAAWAPIDLAATALADGAAGPGDNFLAAATRLINDQGHSGASVEKIAASLNLTKGAFYHHHEAKDELIQACYGRSCEVMRLVQHEALRVAATQWDGLCAGLATLIAYQLSEAGPLLRSDVVHLVPEPIRAGMLAPWNRVFHRFAGMVADGIAEGSVRAVDPFLAARMLHAAINSVTALPRLAPRITAGDAVALYAQPALFGLFVGE
ncbi:MAG TPA: TetR/AcrR family transcriptional regulator [Acetobacteraceae bacterium]|nr:TetR/AcrR family transcriptional regulator [Acetobacteraceae bacterium]